jgi:photosystem II oxygen-evolving enhancer protein 2
MEVSRKLMGRYWGILVAIVLGLYLGACNIVPNAGLKPYIDIADGYKFLYPNGWLEVKVSDGPDVVLRDLINPTENASVIISQVSEGKTLEDLGSPSKVGYLLQKKTILLQRRYAIAPPNSGITAELIDAKSRTVKDQTYYLLEYAVTLLNQTRHDWASVVINRGNLYTFNVSTTERRWKTVKSLFQTVVESFSVS